MSSYMKTTIYGKLHQNLRGAVHLLCQMRWIDPVNDIKDMHFCFVALEEHEQEAKLLDRRLARGRTAPANFSNSLRFMITNRSG